MVKFQWFWTIFASMACAKQQRERQKRTRFDAISQVDRQRAFLTIATPAFVFLWLFNGKFSMILSDFCIHGVRKATPVTTKANAFWCNFAGRSTACVFEHCTIGIYVHPKGPQTNLTLGFCKFGGSWSCFYRQLWYVDKLVTKLLCRLIGSFFFASFFF